MTLILTALALACVWIAGPWLLAKLLAWPPLAKAIIDRAMRTPYSHITSADGSDVYMFRYWLFNAYSDEQGERAEGAKPRAWWRDLLPAMRVHRIMRPDMDRHLHDHPWNARTFVLRGRYREERYVWDSARDRAERQIVADNPYQLCDAREGSYRLAGDTARLRYGQFHRITHVSDGGVWTLFVTWRYRGTWGFDVDGVKVPWREYLAQRDK